MWMCKLCCVSHVCDVVFSGISERKGTKKCWRAGVRNICYAYFQAKTPFHTAVLPRHDKEKSRHTDAWWMALISVYFFSKHPFFVSFFALFTPGICQHEIKIDPTVFILMHIAGHVVNDLCFCDLFGSIVMLHNPVNSRWIKSRPTLYFFLIEYSVLLRKICYESSSMFILICILNTSPVTTYDEI